MITRANFGENLEPGLNKIFGDAYKEYTQIFPQVFNVEGSTKATETSLQITGLGEVPTKVEGADTDYNDPKQDWTNAVTHLTYALGFKVSKELVDDDQYRKINAFPKFLARSMNHTREKVAANVLNNAFDSTVATFGDGKELCATDHALGAGGTYKNEPTTAADLSKASFEQAMIDIGDFVDGAGLNIMAQGKRLVVPNELQFTAKELLGSTHDPESANNTINSIQGEMPYTSWNFLTDPDAWFIITDVPNGLTYFNREAPNFSREMDFDADVAKFKVRSRFSVTCDDPRGIYGSPGA